MDKSEIVLQTQAVSLGYGRKTVLRDVDLTIRAGEFWCFLGQNGVGKTTLLRALLGLLQPQAGQLRFHPELGRRERMGFVPQRCDLNPTLPITVREFTLLGLVGIRASRTQQGERLAWALEKTSLSDMADKDYWSLSGGQRQRALVARALVRRPTLLILDEPTNNLDLPKEDAFLQTLSVLHTEERNTILFVTHNVNIAARYATRIGLVASGTLLTNQALTGGTQETETLQSASGSLA